MQTRELPYKLPAPPRGGGYLSKENCNKPSFFKHASSSPFFRHGSAQRNSEGKFTEFIGIEEY